MNRKQRRQAIRRDIDDRAARLTDRNLSDSEMVRHQKERIRRRSGNPARRAEMLRQWADDVNAKRGYL
jgi:hypothetical protein